MDSIPVLPTNQVAQDPATEMKALFRDSLACKDHTLQLMNNIDKVSGIQGLQQITVDQRDCLGKIESLFSKYGDKISHYEKAMRETSKRITIEKFLVEKTLDGDANLVTVGYYTLPSVRERESKEWQIVESSSNKGQKDGDFHPSLFLISGWAFFILVIFVLLLKGKDSKKPLPFDSEKVKLYFADERAKFSSFLIKFFQKDENDKK